MSLVPAETSQAIAIPDDFVFNEVPPQYQTPPPPTPSLGPLAAFVGNWTGHGINTIFRPQNPTTPADLPTPVPDSDNVLEINLTADTISFSPSLGAVPNRAEVQPSGVRQGDIFLNGVPYLQTVKDVTNPAQPVGIHVEPGLWMCVPPTIYPDETLVPPKDPNSLVRMASIPHGTALVAQGTSTPFTGAPVIPPVDITPFTTSGGIKIPFVSQVLSNLDTARIPQDLGPFNAAGTITQAILTDPNTVLRSANAGLTIIGGTTISISTSPALPLFGGGTENIAFLLGLPGAILNPDIGGENAQTLQMSATFWIETVQHTLYVPPLQPGQPAQLLQPVNAIPGVPSPNFVVRPPIPIGAPRQITVTSTQIQYSQLVLLNFGGLTWPHVSVSTLVPSRALTVPPETW